MLGAGRRGIFIGNEERSFVAMFLPDRVGAGRTDFPIGNERDPSTPDGRSGQTPFVGCLVNHNRDPYPVYFVSIASKGFSQTVSLLFATLAGRSISVAAKGLTGADCWRESR